MTHDELVAWLLEGDVAIQYQTWRDLLDEDRPELQARIPREGWGARFLAARQPDGYWSARYYQPKWISAHYTLLDLRNLDPPHDVPEIQASIRRVFTEERGADGGIDPSRTIGRSDVCVNGMMLHVAAWFETPADLVAPVVDFVLDQHMPDGGFNCRRNRSGARHSSVHSTLSVLEGFQSLLEAGYTQRADELSAAADAAREFLLVHRLFRSHRTGEVIHRDFLRLSYPGRWRFDVLRALDHFQRAEVDDPRLADGLAVLHDKRRRDGRWNLNARIPGQTHFDMEQAGQPSRWNTLRALRVLRRLKGQERP